MTPDDLDVMARTIWGEARGEPLEGKIAVAWVICNRANHPGWWGAGIESVCRKSFQFSCWNKNDPNRDKLIEIHFQDLAFRDCLMVTAAVLSNNLPDPTGGADHYHTESIRPPWAADKTARAKIGAHLFYKL